MVGLEGIELLVYGFHPLVRKRDASTHHYSGIRQNDELMGHQ